MWKTSHPTVRTPLVPCGLSLCPALQCRQGGDSGACSSVLPCAVCSSLAHREPGELMSDKATPLEEPGQFVPGTQW